MLANYDVVILGDIAVSPAQATMFDDWVTARRQPHRDASRP